MKSKICLVPFLSIGIFVSSAWSAEVTVKMIVGGSPCAGGPTNCVALTKTGKIRIEDGDGAATLKNIHKTGITEVKLREGTYLFSYEPTRGHEEPVEQDVRGSSTNVVFIKYGTGIR